MSEIVKLVEMTEERFTEIAPAEMKFASEKGFAIATLTNNSFLAKIAMENRASLVQSVVNVAAIGLTLNPAEKLCYLVPRKGAICLDISYMGFCRLATNSGSVSWVQAEVVRENDTFTLNGVGERPTHSYDPFASLEKRGELVGVYCVAKTGEDYLVTTMSAEEVTAIRDRSESWKKGQSGPWKTDPVEMWKKTVIRRAYKLWPRTDKYTLDRMAKAVESSYDAEGWATIEPSNPQLEPASPGQKEMYNQLLEAEDALEFYAFVTSLPERTRNDLYHSFEKGTKGRYQKIHDSLYEAGANAVADYVDLFGNALRDGDDLVIKENAEELSAEVMAIVAERLGPQQREFEDILGELAA